MIVMIGYDRYNVIVKGFNGVKITPCVAFGMIMFAFLYSTAVCILPLLEVWGKYRLEGLLVTCSFDYLTDDWVNMSFTAFFFGFCYVVPVLFICFFYSQIVAAVVNHERALKAQAKKMNVESLRSNEVNIVLLFSYHAIQHFLNFRTRMLRVLRYALPRWPSLTSVSGSWPGLLMGQWP